MNYEEIIRGWVEHFKNTMNEGILSPGDESGESPSGVKIIFDGYGDLETDDEYVEGGNHSMMSFAVFVHKTSLTEEFPEHEQTPWALIHRPKEEICVWVWYDEEEDLYDVIPYEDRDIEWVNEAGEETINKLIYAIWVRDKNFLR